jgi:hypothetical protein
MILLYEVAVGDVSVAYVVTMAGGFAEDGVIVHGAFAADGMTVSSEMSWAATRSWP